MSLPREVAVIGAGTMGAGIARVFADGGARVRLSSRRRESLDAAGGRLGRAEGLLTTSRAGGRGWRLSWRRRESLGGAGGRLGRAEVLLTTSLDEALDGADLVVETI